MTELTTDVPGLPAWPERRARRTAANAALADFRREYRNWMGAGMRAGEVDWINWAERLANHLSTLIPCVDGNPVVG